MLEHEGVLVTWNLFELPEAWQAKAAAGQRPAGAPLPEPPTSEVLAATKIHNHRLAYLDYEGPISGRRGQVIRVDRGEYQVLEQTDEFWHVQVRGDRILGIIQLRQKLNDHWQLQVNST